MTPSILRFSVCIKKEDSRKWGSYMNFQLVGWIFFFRIWSHGLVFGTTKQWDSPPSLPILYKTCNVVTVEMWTRLDLFTYYDYALHYTCVFLTWYEMRSIMSVRPFSDQHFTNLCCPEGQVRTKPVQKSSKTQHKKKSVKIICTWPFCLV